MLCGVTIRFIFKQFIEGTDLITDRQTTARLQLTLNTSDSNMFLLYSGTLMSK